MGRWLGSMNPAVGELMGAVIGYAIGKYIDDFFTMILSAKYFSKALQPFGFTLKDCFRITFDKQVFKESIWFGFQSSLTPIVNSFTSLAMVFMYLDKLPQYGTFLALAQVALGITGLMKAQDFQMTANIAESYMNGKKKLASFYVKSAIKWNGFLMIFITSLLISVIPMLLGEVLKLPGLENYLLAAPFILPSLISNFIQSWIGFPDGIITGAKRVGVFTAIRLSEEFLQVFFIWLYLYVLQLQDLGLPGIIFILAFEHAFPRVIKMLMGFVYTHQKILKIKINMMQTFLIPTLASLPVFLIGFSYYAFVFSPMIQFFSFLGAYAVIGPSVIYLIIVLLIVPIFVYMPLSGFLGGWDDFQLYNLKKASKLSGPMKFVAQLFYKSISFGATRSPWHNKFKIDWEGAEKEIKELMEIKENQVDVDYESVSK